MRITQLSLTNFRSFKTTQTINITPVTLLVGPNSSGKSSILLALFYLLKVIEKGQCNPQRIENLNNKYIGGFINLIHGHDYLKKILIRIEFDKDGRLGSSYGAIEDFFENFNLGISSPSEMAQKMSITFEISWSDLLSTAYVSRYTVAFDGENIAEISSDSGLRQPTLSAINFLHPLLLPENHDEWMTNSVNEGKKIHIGLKDNYLSLTKTASKSKKNNHETHNDEHFTNENSDVFNENAYASEFHEILTELRGFNKISDFPTDGNLVDEQSFAPYKIPHVPISIETRSGSLPALAKKSKTLISMDNAVLNERINEIISDLVVAPLDNLYSLLKDSLCIGPVRVIPDALFQHEQEINQKDWYDGSAAWHTLGRADSHLIHKVNYWIANVEKLNLGCSLLLRVDKKFTELKSSNDKITYQLIERQLTSRISQTGIGSSNTEINFDAISTQYSYSLWDIKNNVSVYPNEVGVGISQIIPLVIATLSRKQGLIACEQPELHVHPRIQVDIGDLLTQANKNVNFLIETHSEHLVLRLLKRIRQTTENVLPSDTAPVCSNDISIIYIEPTTEGAQVKQIEIDEDGEFKQRWPHGFFSERREELI
ncbi:TPA: DUF3696 domain-containing protein [Serratia fonticola]